MDQDIIGDTMDQDILGDDGHCKLLKNAINSGNIDAVKWVIEWQKKVRI